MAEKIYDQFLIPVTGNNFSGRSNYLKSLTGNNAENINTPKLIYIGEQPSNYISGIFPTVKNEIDLHSISKFDNAVLYSVKKLFTKYDFEKHFHKNPFTLSGGEQTILVILCNLLLYPEKLAIDTTIEQLSEEWRLPLFDAIQKGWFFNTKIYLADNRLTEYQLNNLSITTNNTELSSYNYIFQSPSLKRRLQAEAVAPSIEFEDLSFSYDKRQIVLDKIKFRLEPHTIYSLTGSNGSGKTTLAKILIGILKLKKGRIKVKDKAYEPFKYPGKLVGYSFQNPDEQFFSSTVEKEVLIPLKKETADYTERREIFLEMFGLQNVRECHPAELPFVMRKRISLAATLAIERPWYIFDEPTLGQDDSFVEFFIALLNDLTKEGKGIIVISHSKSFTEKLKGKNLNLKAGKINNYNQ